MATVRDSRAPVTSREFPTLHELAIRTLVNSDPNIHRNGFRAAIKELVAELDGDEECLVDGFLPDAYKIDRDAQEILIYEVEDSHPLPPNKLRLYSWFWFCWEAEGHHEWLPRLFTVDRYGRATGEIDLCAAYYAFLDNHRVHRPAL